MLNSKGRIDAGERWVLRRCGCRSTVKYIKASRAARFYRIGSPHNRCSRSLAEKTVLACNPENPLSCDSLCLLSLFLFSIKTSRFNCLHRGTFFFNLHPSELTYSAVMISGVKSSDSCPAYRKRYMYVYTYILTLAIPTTILLNVNQRSRPSVESKAEALGYLSPVSRLVTGRVGFNPRWSWLWGHLTLGGR